MKSNHADTEERRLAVSRNAGSTKSAFAPRKHARSRSERRLSPEVLLPAFLTTVTPAKSPIVRQFRVYWQHHWEFAVR